MIRSRGEPLGMALAVGIAIAAVLVAALLGLVVWPIVRLFVAALGEGADSVVRGFDARAVGAIGNSLGIAAVVTPLSVAIGTAAGIGTERLALPGRHVFRVGLILPLVIPPFVTALGWTRAYGPGGVGAALTGFGWGGIYGPLGLVVVLVATAVPLAYLVVAAALASRAEPATERAARASGAGAWTVARTITLPLLRPAMGAAAVLVFITTMNAFGVPAVLAVPAGFDTITTRLYQDLALSADPRAFTRVLVLACSLVIVAAAIVGVGDAIIPGAPVTRTSTTAGGDSARGMASRASAALLAGYIVVTGLLPLAALVLTALTRAAGLAPVPSNWTLANFATALSGRGLEAGATSIGLAVAAATVVVVLGTAAAAVAGRVRNRTFAVLATLTFALPGSALAIAILLAYGPWLRDTLALILVAYVAKFWAVGLRQIAGSRARQPRDLTWSARASGAGPLTAARTVLLPALRPAIAGAWLLVFLFAFHEVTMSVLLYGPGTATLAVVVLNLQQLGDPTVTSATAVVLTAAVLVAAVPVVIAGRQRLVRAE